VATLTHDTFSHPEIVTFGSPCQDLSVAGRRAGLDGERSGLFLQAVRYIRDIQEATDGRLPTVAVWENVPGAFSTNGGDDFAAVLAHLVGGEIRSPTDGWTTAGVAFGPLGSAEWRVLDSQHFGVPQRRRRIFLAYRPGGDRAGEVLLESEGVRGNPAPSAAEGEGPAGPLEARAGGRRPSADGAAAGHLIAHAVTSKWAKGTGGPSGDEAQNLVATYTKARRAQSVEDHETWVESEVAPTLTPFHRGDVRSTTVAVEGVTIKGSGEVYGTGDQAGSITTVGGTRGTSAIAFAMRGRDEGNVPEVDGDGQRVSTLRGASGGSTRDMLALAPTITATNDPSRSPQSSEVTQQVEAVHGATHAVRRLTPRECERLQAFPDDWTRYRPDGSEIADSHRYRMLGNAVTTSVVAWIAPRLEVAKGEPDIRDERHRGAVPLRGARRSGPGEG